MHLDFIGSFIFAADRVWVWLAAYCFALASAYSAYTLFAGKFMAPRLTFGLVVAGFVCQTIFLGIRGHAVGQAGVRQPAEPVRQAIDVGKLASQLLGAGDPFAFARHLDALTRDHRDSVAWASDIITEVLGRLVTDQDDLFRDGMVGT